MTIIHFYIMIQNNEYHFDKPFVPHQFDLVGIVKVEDVFFKSCFVPVEYKCTREHKLYWDQ